jgi:hypothetical protein
MDQRFIVQRTYSKKTMIKSFPDLFKTQDRRNSLAERRRAAPVKLRPIQSKDSTEMSQQEYNDMKLKAAYNPLDRSYNSCIIGKVKLPNTVFQLADDTELGSIFASKGQQLEKPVLEIADKLEEFRKLRDLCLSFNKPRPDYRKCIMRCLKELRNLQVTSVDCSRLDNIVCKLPYDKPLAHSFIRACKKGSYPEVEHFIMQDRFVVHVFDSMEMTGLHWAVKRNHIDVITLLLTRRANVDAIDLVSPTQTHRTPLHIAARMNLLEPVRLLLSARADPFIKTNTNKLPIKLAESPLIVRALRKAMSVRPP